MKGLIRHGAWWLVILAALAACAGGPGGPPASSDRAPAPEVAFEGQYNESCFSDERLDINLLVNDGPQAAFILTLTNKTGAPILVRWDQVVFLDARGNAQHMIHQGVGFGQGLNDLAPTWLEDGLTLNDLLRPSKAVLEGDVWRLAPLSGLGQAKGQEDLRLRIDLPLEITGRVYVYRFRYHLEAAPTDQDDLREWGRQEP